MSGGLTTNHGLRSKFAGADSCVRHDANTANSRRRHALQSLAHALWVCAWMATLASAPQRVWAGSDTWADISDVTQYVPLAWAVMRTYHATDAEGAFQLAAAGATTVGSSELLKRITNQKRPNYRPGDRKRSFPSGHVAKAWFAAAHLQRRYGCYELEWSCWRGSAIPYVAAVATAIGRVRADRHHVSDVMASAAIAEVWVRITTDRFDDDMRIVPTLENGFGIAIFKEF